jgi:hypothetical protein
MNTTKLVLPFLDFSTLSYEFSKLAGREKMTKALILHKETPGKF